MATVHAPVTTYSGRVAGVDFTDGVGETDDDRALAYFTRKGYGIDKPAEPTEDGPEPPDPRDASNVHGGTRLRDAAVDPEGDDFLPPTNAGQANPHGSKVVSPQIHAAEQGAKPITGGPVASDAKAQQAKETAAATKAVTDGPGPAATDDTSDAEPPAGNATTEEWRTYARTQADDADELAAIDEMNRDDLRDTYGPA